MADLVLVLFLAVFTLMGIKKGFISTLLGFASTIVSFILTSLVYKPFASLLYASPLGEIAKSIVEKSLTENVNGGEVLAQTPAVEAGAMLIVNVISFILIIILVKLLVAIFVNIAKLASKLPIIKQANSLLGGIIGCISGLFIAYIAIGALVALGDNDIWLSVAQSIRDSSFASLFASGNFVCEIVSSVL